MIKATIPPENIEFIKDSMRSGCFALIPKKDKMHIFQMGISGVMALYTVIYTSNIERDADTTIEEVYFINDEDLYIGDKKPIHIIIKNNEIKYSQSRKHNGILASQGHAACYHAYREFKDKYGMELVGKYDNIDISDLELKHPAGDYIELDLNSMIVQDGPSIKCKGYGSGKYYDNVTELLYNITIFFKDITSISFYTGHDIAMVCIAGTNKMGDFTIMDLAGDAHVRTS